MRDSLRGNLLQHAGTHYLHSVRSGLSLVITGILLQIALPICTSAVWVLMFVYSVMSSGPASGSALIANTNASVWYQLAYEIQGSLGLVVSLAILLGYWRYTTPDPGSAGDIASDRARAAVRGAVCIQLAAKLIMMLAGFVVNAVVATSVLSTVMDTLSALALVADSVGWLVQFVGVMYYTRWLGWRVPDALIVEQSRSYLIVLPVVAVLGAPCLLLGPLLALILYWNLLNRLRKHLVSIERTGVPAALPKMTA